MRPVLCLPIALVSLVACAEAPNDPSESTTTAAVVSVNRIASNRIASNRIASNRIASNRMTVNRSTTRDLLETADGRDVFALLVSCALGDDVALTATVDGMEFDFPGELGLAPGWLSGALDATSQRWVSACVFSRVNARDVALPISMRGPTPALDVDDDERAGWTLEEGGFFGNMFGPLDQPIQWFACRGRDLAAGDTGGLADRDCARPDPDHPGLTLCGFFFAGDCGAFAADRTCESFSGRGTFYQNCHTAPIERFHSCPGNFGRGRADDRVFGQVITTFVTP